MIPKRKLFYLENLIKTKIIQVKISVHGQTPNIVHGPRTISVAVNSEFTADESEFTANEHQICTTHEKHAFNQDNTVPKQHPHQ